MAAHLEPAYAGTSACRLPVTERLTASSLVLPLFHEMTELEQDVVVSVICARGRDRLTRARRVPRLSSQTV